MLPLNLCITPNGVAFLMYLAKQRLILLHIYIKIGNLTIKRVGCNFGSLFINVLHTKKFIYITHNINILNPIRYS